MDAGTQLCQAAVECIMSSSILYCSLYVVLVFEHFFFVLMLQPSAKMINERSGAMVTQSFLRTFSKATVFRAGHST
uniref:Uncharacterized protein n=1 Tax=Triticum urartu TaxID=4572 RepID=A0A8R7QBA2_TRIUA